MYICISRYHLIRYDLPFHLARLSFTHIVMIYSYRLIRGRFARPDRRIVGFRVCVSLVSDDAPYSDFCAPFKTGLTINSHSRRSSSGIVLDSSSILSRSEQAIPIPEIHPSGWKHEDLSFFLSLSRSFSRSGRDDSIRAQVHSKMLE